MYLTPNNVYRLGPRKIWFVFVLLKMICLFCNMPKSIILNRFLIGYINNKCIKKVHKK